jgi:type I restriction enzyme S subunit
MGQSPPGESYNKEGIGIPLLNGPTEFGPEHPIEQQWTTRPTKLCKRGDILFCVRGATAGRLNVADKEYCLGRGVAAIRAIAGKFDERFLLHVLRSGYAKFQARGVGSTFINISSEELSNFEVPLVPFSEQRRIAAILDQAEALRAKRRYALAKLDTLTQSLFLDLFGDPATNPKHWPTAQLGDVIHSATDGPHVSPAYADEGVPFVSARHIRRGEILWTDLKFLSGEDAFVHWRKCKPERGDILYTKGGTTGIAKVIDFDQQIALWVHVALLKTNRNRVDPLWLENMLNSDFCYLQSQRLTHGIANRDLGLKIGLTQKAALGVARSKRKR